MRLGFEFCIDLFLVRFVQVEVCGRNLASSLMWFVLFDAYVWFVDLAECFAMDSLVYWISVCCPLDPVVWFFLLEDFKVLEFSWLVVCWRGRFFLRTPFCGRLISLFSFFRRGLIAKLLHLIENVLAVTSLCGHDLDSNVLYLLWYRVWTLKIWLRIIN